MAGHGVTSDAMPVRHVCAISTILVYWCLPCALFLPRVGDAFFGAEPARRFFHGLAHGFEDLLIC
jgi:hypothetical protein